MTFRELVQVRQFRRHHTEHAVWSFMIPIEPAGVIPSLSASSLDYQANTHNVHDYVHEMTDFSVIFRFPAYQKTTPGCPGAVAKITSSIHHDVITRGKYTNLFE